MAYLRVLACLATSAAAAGTIAAGMVAAASPAGADELRIGYLNTTTGSGALLGRHLENGWKLGLADQGWTKNGDRLGGVPTRIFYADDQSRPETGLKEVEKFLKSDKVHIVAGIIWSNVIMSVQKPVFDAKAMLLSTNAGPSPLAGRLCNRLFVSSSFYNEGNSEALGEIAAKDGVKSVLLMAPNYQGGKDMLAGFVSTFRGGTILDTILFKLGESDFQADLGKLRASKAEALAIFAPGAMGVAFIKQWVASGLGKSVKLYTINTIDNMSLPALGDAALGAVEAQHWTPDLDVPANKRFVKEYVARYNSLPSHLAAAAYDAPGLIARGVKAVGGKLGDMAAVARAIRKSKFDSPRGTLSYNVNGFLLHPNWRVQVVKGSDGKPAIKAIENLGVRKDPHWPQCPPDKRI
ncbi:MAG: ABC transporter substrate-binding protein [Rhodospirillaceae bacterium]|nr:ABC transporter substrate-binding protein [Rhodospirillaceae bacterium]